MSPGNWGGPGSSGGSGSASGAQLRVVSVVRPGPLTTVQDGGRPGQGALGIGASGACDRASHRLANALVGNRASAATLEVTLGGLILEARGPVVVATTGARCPGCGHNAPIHLAAGERLILGTPEVGLRTYVAVRGGFDVEPVLGSRSTDLLSGLGPPRCAAGDELPVGDATETLPGVDLAAVAELPGGPVSLRVSPGPRRDWFGDDAWHAFLTQTYAVSADSNRVGVRLAGEPLHRERSGELPSEGLVRGAIQIPPSGTPVLFLADHPVTGGYPVIAYVDDAGVDLCGQLRPGQPIHFIPG